MLVVTVVIREQSAGGSYEIETRSSHCVGKAHTMHSSLFAAGLSLYRRGLRGWPDAVSGLLALKQESL